MGLTKTCQTRLMGGVALWVLTFTGSAYAQDGAFEDSATPLQRIVVGTGVDKVAIDTPQAVTVLDQDAIDAQQARTIGDVFKEIPGVMPIGSNSVFGESINIRGIGENLSSDETRIILQVDGVNKFFEQYRMGSFFSDPELYKQVEVLRGPASSTLYGSGAMGGVVTFTTKDASDFLDPGDKFGGRLKTSWDSNGNGWLGSAIVAAEPIENAEILGALNYRKSQDLADGQGNDIDDSDFDSINGLIKGRYTFGANNDQSVFASYQRWTSDEDNQGYDQITWGTTFGNVDRTVTDQTAIAGYENAFTGNNLLDFKAQVSWSDTRVKQSNMDPVCFGPTTCVYAFGLNSEYSYETWQGKADNVSTFDLGSDWMAYVTTGLDAQYQERRNPRDMGAYTQSGSATHPEGETKNMGGFVQTEFVWNDRVTLIPGMRIDYGNVSIGSYTDSSGDTVTLNEEKTKIGYSPKLAAMVKMTDWLGIFGSVAHTERLPSLDEVFSNYTVNAIEKEKSNNFEAGFTLAFDDLVRGGDAFRLKTTAFRNNITDYYASYWNGTTVVTDIIPEARYEGFEVEASYWTDTIYGTLGASVIRGKNRDTGGDLNAVPADNAFLKIGYVHRPWNLDFGWRGDFYAAQDRVGTSGNTTAGYALHNLYAAWKPDEGLMAGSELRFNVDNVFDKSYRNHLDGDEGAGRSFKLSFAKTF
ncbi:TonB-dependent receptor domain-containing protein [Roseibium denhamense]|uniref:Hemoglobin/transferrin/lactoferrin receptor protein n=1 Tax=Roseibium denhamense TaxID=76305 RepID=A0ABY1P7K7_9HYPH|nr:TonB-dependent receptor [Roseibium denhamense]SMP26842.1 hemoglobin/transferrin/lactoferrin receptor protein [Roseibium denhamense]